MACHTPGLIVAHMRSGPLKAYHVLGQITAQIRSGPLRGFGLNYGPYQIRPVDWTLCFWAHLLKAHLVSRPDISFGLLTAHLMDGPIFRMYIFRPFSDPFKCWANFRPDVSFSLLTAHKSVGPIVVGPEFWPFSDPFKCWANSRPCVPFGLLTDHK